MERIILDNPKILYANESTMKLNAIMFVLFIIWQNESAFGICLFKAVFITRRLDHIEMNLIKIEKMVSYASFDDTCISERNVFNVVSVKKSSINVHRINCIVRTILKTVSLKRFLGIVRVWLFYSLLNNKIQFFGYFR